MKATGIVPLQTITIEDILRACPRFIKAGKLGAQCTVLGSHIGGCYYQHPTNGSSCIVGTAMTEATRRKLIKEDKNGCEVGHLISSGTISIPKEQRLKIQHLQKLHDTWSLSVSKTVDKSSPSIKEAKTAFYNYLKELHKEYAT